MTRLWQNVVTVTASLRGMRTSLKTSKLLWPTVTTGGILEDDTKECLEMIAHKIGRILNGDPSYADNFTDICGYSRLVEKRLIDEQVKVKDGVPELESMGDMFLKSLSELNRVSIGEKLAGVKPAPAKPTDEEIRAALELLLAAGVVSVVDGDS